MLPLEQLSQQPLSQQELSNCKLQITVDMLTEALINCQVKCRGTFMQLTEENYCNQPHVYPTLIKNLDLCFHKRQEELRPMMSLQQIQQIEQIQQKSQQPLSSNDPNHKTLEEMKDANTKIERSPQELKQIPRAYLQAAATVD